MTDNTEADRLESPARADNADEPENGGGLRAKLSTALDVVVSAVAALLYAFIASGAGVDLALPGVVVGVLVLLGLVDTAAEYLGFNSNDGSTLRGRLHNLALLIVALVPAAVGGIVVTTFGGLLSELVYVAGVGVSAFVWFARLHSSDSVEACINRAAARTGVAQMLPSVAGISGLMLLGLLLGALGLLYVAYAEYKEEGRGARKVRGGGEKAAGGLRRSISLSRAAGAAVAVLGHTALVEFFNLGWSLFDLLGPLVTSNILAIGIGGLGIAGVIPVDPMWYVGVMLMVFGIALSTVTDEWFERNSTRD